jgi:hypothetical protein
VSKQRGTVLVFKPGTGMDVIRRALDQLAPILDERQFIDDAGRMTPYRVWEFNPDHGGPVWYIP